MYKSHKYLYTHTYVYIYTYMWLIKVYFLVLFSVLVLSESKDIYLLCFFLDTLIKLLYLVLVIFTGFFVSVLCKTSQTL